MRLRSRLDLLVIPAALAAITIGAVEVARGSVRAASAPAVAQDSVRVAHALKPPPPVIARAARLAAALYGVSEREMINVSRCETVSWTDYVNERSGAAGPWQFLPATWRAHGVPGHSPHDPYAAALATARMVARDGGWRQWECKPG